MLVSVKQKVVMVLKMFVQHFSLKQEKVASRIARESLLPQKQIC